ncbi:MAG: hypothetical protein AAFQ09_01475 [Pseudomonadota bacterium]
MLGRFVLLAAVAAVPSLSSAQCRIAVAGTACVSIPKPLTPPPGPVAIGEVLDRGEYSMLMNAPYYGLPNVSDGWVYMRIEDEIYRVDWRSHKVLERVTHLASRNWR